jgi:hypothetical protein
MVFPAATPKPFTGPSPSAEDNLLQQSHKTGVVIPDAPIKNASAVTKNEPTVKPWAHFVAGG